MKQAGHLLICCVVFVPFLRVDITSAQTTSLEAQRTAVAKLKTYRKDGSTNIAAGIYVGRAETKCYFAAPWHSFFSTEIDDQAEVTVDAQLYDKRPVIFRGSTLMLGNRELDLTVIVVPICDLPPDLPKLTWKDAVSNTPIHLIGHPPAGDWSIWAGVVENEIGPGGNVQLFTTSADASLVAGYSGAPVFDSGGYFIGMHTSTSASYSYATNLKSRDLVRELAAWQIPMNNIVETGTTAGHFPPPLPVTRDAEMIALCLAVVVGWAVFLWKHPLLVLKIDEKLGRSPSLKPAWLGGLEIPIRYAILVGFFNYRNRVLDAWVGRHIETARERFAKNPIVTDREIYIEAPAYFNGKAFPSVTPQQLQTAFSSSSSRVLIWGEGGVGKTSLACQIAWRGMDLNASNRLRTRPMIPVLIEEDFASDAGSDPHPFVKTVRDKLTALLDTETPPSQELVLHLLKRNRILVVVDGFSELNEETRSGIPLASADFPANSLVLTSRTKELMGIPSVTTIQPMRIQANRLLSFMESYLAQKGKRHLFDDTEFISARNRLQAMLATRDSTVLFATLYADYMIASKEDNSNQDIPRNIPDLILSYLNNLNRGARGGDPNDRAVHKAAKVIAWECLRETYQPKPASLSNVLNAFSQHAVPERLVEYLDERLRLVQVIGAGRDRIKYALDPLAEYLAALQLMYEYGDDVGKWRGFCIRIAELASPDSSAIKSFLTAIQECCRDTKAPVFVSEEMGKWISEKAFTGGPVTRLQVSPSSELAPPPLAQAELKHLTVNNIQTAHLIPHIPPSKYFDIAAVPLTSESEATATYYDIIPLAGGRMGIAIADVSGRGLDSVRYAAALQTAFGAIARTDVSLPEIFQQANEFLLERGRPETSAALIYSVFEPSGRFEYLNAGNAPSLLVRANGDVSPIEQSNFPIGLFKDATFESDSLQLAAGDWVVTFTDEVTEARDRYGSFLGETRVRELVANNRQLLSANDMLLALLRGVNEFLSPMPRPADSVVVVLRFLAPDI
jgi:hypothetical protein